MRQVLVIHGGDTFQTQEECLAVLKEKTVTLEDFQRSGWKSGLQSALGDSYAAYIPSMPNKQNARYIEWKVWFEKLIALMDDGVILIGHSLGGAFLAKYLSTERCPRRIGAVFLIAPCYDEQSKNDGRREYLGAFLPPKDKRLFSEQAGKIFLYHSKDDAIVPFSSLADYQEDLPMAIVQIFENRGHFLGEEFPELVDAIRSL